MEALLIPWVLLLLVLVVAFCLFKKWWKASVAIVIVLLLANWHWNVFSFGFNSLDKQKDPGCLRVLTWNISCADSTGTDDVDGLVQAIMIQDADVVFLTEYSKDVYPEIDSVMCIRYPYKGGFPTWMIFGEFYSRVPIDTCMRIGGEGTGHLYRLDMHFADKSIRLYNLHLQSNNIIDGEQFYPDSIADRGGVSRYLDNYKAASGIRREQAELVVSDMMDCPCIVMGDMNDVAGSPCMKVFAEAGLRDAWWEGGFGYGATIHEPVLYRIDHVMYGIGLELKGIKKVSSKGLSDHDALVADFTLR